MPCAGSLLQPGSEPGALLSSQAAGGEAVQSPPAGAEAQLWGLNPGVSGLKVLWWRPRVGKEDGGEVQGQWGGPLLGAWTGARVHSPAISIC